MLELAISGRHRGHYLWLLTQSYTATPKNLRRQAKAIFVWYPKERSDLKVIHEDNDVLTDNELIVTKKFKKKKKNQNMDVCTYKMNILVGLSC